MAQNAFRFNIEPIHRFASVNAAIRRPREITSFSYDEEHKFRPDESSLRYYYPPLLPVDLNKGFHTFRQLDDSNDDHIDGLLQALILYESEKCAKTEVDIVTWRGMMTKIMTVPFSKLDSWEMNATFFQGTIYIEENHEKKLASREKQYSAGATPGNMSQDLMSFWGYKFETISLLPRHWCHVTREEIESREEEIVSNYAQYCSIVRTGFNKTKIIIGGEVDAVLDYRSEDRTRPTNWVELKTTAELTGPKDEMKLERKLLKFWAQSFLLGVPKIVVGYRTQQGMLERLEEMDTQTIPDKVQARGKRLWHGQTCIDYTASFLEWLKDTIKSDGVWRIRKRENVPFLEVDKVEETGFGDILPQAFLNWRLKELPAMLQQSESVRANGSDATASQQGIANQPGAVPMTKAADGGSKAFFEDAMDLLPRDHIIALSPTLPHNGHQQPP